MNGDKIVDRRIGRDHDGAGADDMVTGLDLRGRTALDLVGVRLCEDAAAVALDRPGKPGQVFERVDLSLVRKAKTGARVKGV